MYDAITIADTLLKIAKRDGKSLTPMQLVKLVYIAYGWFFAIFDRKLFNNRIEAWQYGPVIPDLYHETKIYGRSPIPLHDIGEPNDILILEEDVKEFLEKIFKAYDGMDGIQLSSLTHRPGTPWTQVYQPNVHGIQIPDELICKHYKELANE